MGKLNGQWEMISDDDFEAVFLDELIHGAVLGFKQPDGSMRHWKVCRINQSRRQWWIKPWKLYHPDDMQQLQADRRQQMNDDFNQDLTKLIGEDNTGGVRKLMAKHAFYQIPTAMGRNTTIYTTDGTQEPLLTYDEWQEAYEQHEITAHPVDDVAPNDK